MVVWHTALRIGLLSEIHGSDAEVGLGSSAAISDRLGNFRFESGTGPNHCESGPRRSNVGCRSMTGRRSAAPGLRLVAKSGNSGSCRVRPLTDLSGILEPQPSRPECDLERAVGLHGLPNGHDMEFRSQRASGRKWLGWPRNVSSAGLRPSWGPTWSGRMTSCHGRVPETMSRRKILPARPFEKSLRTHIQVENPSARPNGSTLAARRCYLG